MNIINTKNRIMRIHDLKQHIQRMSHENIVHYAENNPIIPLENTKEVMSENAGYAGTIQGYCMVINAQPDIQLEEIPSIIPSQQLARENADYWMEELNPKIINTYTQVKQFCNLYSELTEKNIDQLVENINDESGKKEFITIMNSLQAESDKKGAQVNEAARDLNDFDGRLAEDLSNFEDIKKQADDRYLGEEGKLQQLQTEMELHSKFINECNVAIATSSIFLSLGVITIGIGIVLEFANPIWPIVNYFVLTGGIILTGVSGGILGFYVKAKKEAQENYQRAAVEFEKAQTQCAVLQALSDNFTSLGEENIKARGAVQNMVTTWKKIGNNFGEISHVAQDIVSENTQLLIKTKLKAALEDVKDLKDFAIQCENKGILPVTPETELIYKLHLPQSWLNQAIHGDAFRAYVAAKRKKGFFDRGRRGWRTHDQQICIPLYRAVPTG